MEIPSKISCPCCGGQDIQFEEPAVLVWVINQGDGRPCLDDDPEYFSCDEISKTTNHQLSWGDAPAELVFTDFTHRLREQVELSAQLLQLRVRHPLCSRGQQLTAPCQR